MKIVGRVFWGIFFIMAATLVVLNQLGIFSIGISLVKILLLIFLLAIFIKSLVNLVWPGVFFPLAIVGILFAEPLGICNLTPWPILTVALLLSIGFSILFHKRNGWCSYASHKHGKGSDHIIDSPDDSDVSVEVSFGSIIKYIKSEDFKYAKLECSFGSLKVYFDGAKLSEDGAVVELDASFSGMELYFPREWKIINNTDASFGGVDEGYKKEESSGGKVVTLTGDVSFSNVQIIYV